MFSYLDPTTTKFDLRNLENRVLGELEEITQTSVVISNENHPKHLKQQNIQQPTGTKKMASEILVRDKPGSKILAFMFHCNK